jgi:hypothetical protein
VKGYEETFEHHEFARGVLVERKLIDDNRLPQALDMASALGDSAFRVREKAAANVFVNAFSSATSETLDDYGTDATGADSVALCSTAHPRHAGDPATTDTNEGTTALTEAGISSTRRAMSEFVDPNGDLLDVMPDEILIFAGSTASRSSSPASRTSTRSRPSSAPTCGSPSGGPTGAGSTVRTRRRKGKVTS